MVRFHELRLHFLQYILSIACVVIQCREAESLTFTFIFHLSSADPFGSEILDLFFTVFEIREDDLILLLPLQ